MSWAAERRFFVLLIVGAVVLSFIIVLFFTVFYEAPSCGDEKQNQGEAGIDCGGPCTYLCTSQVLPPTVLYTKAIQNMNGRVDVVASIENKNATAAARNVPFTVTLYDATQVLLQQVTGTVDLPPSTKVPIYIPGIVSGRQAVASAFIDIDPSAPNWFTLESDPRIMPAVSDITLGGSINSPRIQATLTNPSIPALMDTRVVVVVHGLHGNVITASQTIVPTIPAQGEATAIFTWNMPFASPPGAIEVTPLIPLPAELP